TKFVPRLTHRERERHRERRRIEREPRPPRRVIARENEGAHLFSASFTLGVARRADDRADLGRDDVAIRMNRNEKPAALEREADAAPRRRRSRRGPQTKRLAFELEELFGVDLAAELLDALEDSPLRRRELVDLFGELLGIAERLPRRLERER